MDSKKAIRKQILEIRNHMLKEEWEEKSQKIYKKVISHPFFLETDTIYCYISYRNEVDTLSIIEKALKLGKTVAVPKVTGAEMEFYQIHSFEEVAAGYKGILEPTSTVQVSGEEGLVIMPGVAFDKKKNRIGFGKGYYDCYLSKHSHLKTMALAMELQLVENIPAEENDILPQILITEEHIYV